MVETGRFSRPMTRFPFRKRGSDLLDSLRRHVRNTLSDGRTLVTLSKFALVGGSGIVVNNLILSVLYAGGHLPLLAASAAAVEITVVYNFILDNRWAFGRSEVSMQRFARFNLASLGALVVNTTALWFLVSEFRLHYLAANLLAIGVASGVNLAGARWTWGFAG